MTTPIGVSSSDPWWLSNQCQIRQAAANPGGWLGPYPSRVAAEAAAKSAGCGGGGGGGGGGSGQWWVVSQPHAAGGFTTQQSATRPANAVAGPFKTEAEALAWITTQHPNPSLPNPLGWLQEIGHWLGVLVASLTDIHMWISLGWGWLGFLLLLLGVYLWIRFSHTYREVETAVVGAVTKGAVRR